VNKKEKVILESLSNKVEELEVIYLRVWGILLKKYRMKINTLKIV